MSTIINNLFVYPFSHVFYAFGFDITKVSQSVVPKYKTITAIIAKYLIKLIIYSLIIYFVFHRLWLLLYFQNIFYKYQMHFIQTIIKFIIIAISFIYFEINFARVKLLIYKINNALNENEKVQAKYFSKALILIWVVLCLVMFLLNEISIVLTTTVYSI